MARPYIAPLAESIYMFLIDNKGEGYTRDELLIEFGDCIPENTDLNYAFERAMKVVKELADEDGEIVPTPISDNGYTYMIALPSQAHIVLRASVQSGLTVNGLKSINDREVTWVERNIGSLSPADRPLAKLLVSQWKKFQARAEEDKREILVALQDSFREQRATQKAAQPVSVN